MAELERVVSVLPDGTLNHNVMRNAILLLGGAIEARGVGHVVLDGNDPDFARTLLGHTADPSTAIYVGHRFYDLGLAYSDSQGERRRNFFEIFDRPVFAILQDHPFSRFMWARIQHASLTTHFVSPTPEFQVEAQLLNPALCHFSTVSASVTEAPVPARDLRPLRQRPVDLFMSCRFNRTTPSLEQLRNRYATTGHPMTKVIDEVFESGMTERDRPILQLFLDAFGRHLGTPFRIACPMTKADAEHSLVLSCIDLRIRFERRLKVLRGLAQLDPRLRIVVTLAAAARDGIPELRDRANVELIGPVEASRAREIFLQSKFAVNVMPTYVSFVTERVSNAMSLGCCVISDRNNHIARTFAAGEEILFMEDCDPQGLQTYFRDRLDEAEAIAVRGREKARDAFSVTRFADDLLAVMRAAI